MPTLTLECTVTWECDQGDPVEELGDYVSEVKGPIALVEVNAPYAEYVEFGTGPARKRSDHPDPDHVRKKFIKWGEQRGLDASRAEDIYLHVMRFGSKPTPFFRPGVNLVWNGVPEDYLDDHDLESLANLMADKMRQILLDNQMSGFAEPSDVGASIGLYDSIEVRMVHSHPESSNMHWHNWDGYSGVGGKNPRGNYRRGTYP